MLLGVKDSVKKSVNSLPIFRNNHYLCIQITTEYMPEYDIALELARLHILQGADFVRHLKELVQYSIFKAVENEKGIYAAEGNHREDFPMLLDAARKAVTHGNNLYTS